MRSRCSSSSQANRLVRARLSVFIASSRFSNTRVVLEDGRLLELAADAGVGDLRLGQLRQVDGLAEEAAVPASGRVLPVMTSIMVVLPAPLGPMMQRSSPASMVRRQIVQRLEAVEADA